VESASAAAAAVDYINLYSPHGQLKTINHKNNNQSKQTGKQTQIKIQSK